MIIDFHTHIFPKKIRDNKANFFYKEPAFELLYSSSKSTIVGARQIIASMDEHEIDKSVVFGFPWNRSETFKQHNDYIMESVAKYPERLVGFGCFNPLSKSSGIEAERCVQGGVSGIGELAFYQSGIDESCLKRLEPVMEICVQHDLPIMIHTNEPVGHYYPGKTQNTLLQIYMMVKKFQENKIVLAHWGGGIFFYNLLKKEVKDTLKNVYFDTAASPFLYDSEIYRFGTQIAGCEKILFGTDFPLIKPQRYFDEIEKTGLIERERNKIYGANAEKLLKIMPDIKR